MRSTRHGFTLVELMMVIVVAGILMMMAMVKFGRTLSRQKVDRAASVVAADLEQAFSIGGRLRQPVRIKCDCGSKAYRVNDVLNGGALRFTRNMGPNSEYVLDSMRFTPDSATILPPGRVAATTLPFSVTICSAGPDAASRWSRS
jgi:prepilin-type N-terminal cleavage/methylation domain-containing protein